MKGSIEDRIRAYSSQFDGQWECVFNGRRQWKNVSYMRCQDTGLIMFLPFFLFE